jgi:hypothetical protein
MPGRERVHLRTRERLARARVARLLLRTAVWAGVTPLHRTHATARRRLWLSVGIAGGLGASGCSEARVDKPPAPEMTELIAAYTAPDAEFDSAAASDISLAIALIDELLARTDLREQLVDVLAEVLRQATDLSGGEDGAAVVSFDAGGYIRFTRICAGWALPARPDRSVNGALQLTATFSEAGLDPIVWGSAEACRYRVGDGQIELDQVATSAAAVSVYWGSAPSEQDVSERTLLVDLDLEATIDAERAPLDIDFRSLVDGTLEYRIPRPDGSLIARVGSGDGVTLRAANGSFECDAELRCERRAPEAP